MFRCIVHVDEDTDVNDLKRLALIFDEIVIVRPEFARLRATSKLRTKTIQSSESLHISPVNYFTDTERFCQLELEHHSTDLAVGINALIKANIASYANSVQNLDLALKPLKVAAMTEDINDPEFLKIHGTSRERLQYLAFQELRVDSMKFYRLARENEQGSALHHKPDDTIFTITKPLGYRADETEEDRKYLRVIMEPPAIESANIVSDLLLIGEAMDAHPLFLDPMHRRVMKHKYRRLQAVMGAKDPYGNSQSAKFGDISFTFANRIFSSKSIEAKSMNDILDYREKMSISRSRLVSESFEKLIEMMEKSEWDNSLRQKINEYIDFDLRKQLSDYENSSIETWESMFGTFVGHFSKSLPAVATGGSAGLLISSFCHNPVAIALGVATGAMKGFPSNQIVEAYLAKRRSKRNGIAYLAEFNK